MNETNISKEINNEAKILLEKYIEKILNNFKGLSFSRLNKGDNLVFFGFGNIKKLNDNPQIGKEKVDLITNIIKEIIFEEFNLKFGKQKNRIIENEYFGTTIALTKDNFNPVLKEGLEKIQQDIKTMVFSEIKEKRLGLNPQYIEKSLSNTKALKNIKNDENREESLDIFLDNLSLKNILLKIEEELEKKENKEIAENIDFNKQKDLKIILRDLLLESTNLEVEIEDSKDFEQSEKVEILKQKFKHIYDLKFLANIKSKTFPKIKGLSAIKSVFGKQKKVALEVAKIKNEILEKYPEYEKNIGKFYDDLSKIRKGEKIDNLDKNLIKLFKKYKETISAFDIIMPIIGEVNFEELLLRYEKIELNIQLYRLYLEEKDFFDHNDLNGITEENHKNKVKLINEKLIKIMNFFPSFQNYDFSHILKSKDELQKLSKNTYKGSLTRYALSEKIVGKKGTLIFIDIAGMGINNIIENEGIVKKINSGEITEEKYERKLESGLNTSNSFQKIKLELQKLGLEISLGGDEMFIFIPEEKEKSITKEDIALIFKNNNLSARSTYVEIEKELEDTNEVNIFYDKLDFSSFKGKVFEKQNINNPYIKTKLEKPYINFYKILQEDLKKLTRETNSKEINKIEKQIKTNIFSILKNGYAEIYELPELAKTIKKFLNKKNS